MAKKETFIQPLDYIVAPSSLTEGAKRAYAFLSEVPAEDPAFSDTRAGIPADDYRDLWEYMRWCGVVSESIKAAFKKAMSVDDAHMPACFSWEKQTYQCKFTDPVAAARALAERFGKDIAEFTCSLTPTQAMKVANIDEDALTDVVGLNFVKTPKDRTLNIK